jgi:hypothetical protein
MLCARASCEMMVARERKALSRDVTRLRDTP